MNPTEFEGTSETIPLTSERISETAPLKSERRSSSIIAIDTARKTVNTNDFIVLTLIGSIIPIIQVSIGAAYIGDCPIDQLIPTYMIVAGTVGLVLTALSLLLIFTFRCLFTNSEALTVLASCGICCNLLVTFIVLIFCFIWFILGCVWVFSIVNDVQFQFPLKSNYCQPVLYKSAYSLLIITFTLFLIQCCISCCRLCCLGIAD